MNQKDLLFASGISLGLIVVLAIQAYTVAGQQRGPRRPPPPQEVSPLEKSWAGVAFELKVTDDQLSQLRQAYQRAWDARKALQRHPGDTEAMQKLRAEMEQIQANLQTELETILTPEQLDALRRWEDRPSNPARRPRGR